MGILSFLCKSFFGVRIIGHIIIYNKDMPKKNYKLKPKEILEQICFDNDIDIDRVPLKLKKSFAIKEGNLRVIVVDDREMSEPEFVCYLLHELGHFYTDSFYDPYAPKWIRKICEQKASAWAVRFFIAKDNLDCMLKKGMQSWEIAEEYGVHESMIQYAIWFYFRIEGVWDHKLMTAGEK